ncbi:MAG: hypothetical protein Fur0032_19320 [Terrimicrobiaceae bacterium]
MCDAPAWWAARGATLVGGYVRDQMILGGPWTSDLDVLIPDPIRHAEAFISETGANILRWSPYRLRLQCPSGLQIDVCPPFPFDDLSCNLVGYRDGQFVKIPGPFARPFPLQSLIELILRREFWTLTTWAWVKRRKMILRGWTCLSKTPSQCLR